MPDSAVSGQSSIAAASAKSGQTDYMLIGLGLATWMEFYTYDGVNLVLPDMAGTFGISQDQASWILTTYLSALLFGVPLSIWMASHIGYLRYIIGSIAIFAVASVGCTLSPDFETLLFWRAIQSCRDLPNRLPSGMKPGNLTTLFKVQVVISCSHASTLSWCCTSFVNSGHPRL